MNIYAKEGYKVVADNLNCGWPSDAQKAQKYLVKGQVYTVEYTIVDSWSTDVRLKEFPNILFNSVHFKDADNV